MPEADSFLVSEDLDPYILTRRKRKRSTKRESGERERERGTHRHTHRQTGKTRMFRLFRD